MAYNPNFGGNPDKIVKGIGTALGVTAGGAVATGGGTAAIVSAATAAAPIVLGVAAVGLVGYGIYKLFKN